MEYVNGVDLESMSSQVATDALLKETTLKEMGELLVLDFIINNSDRLPCVSNIVLNGVLICKN
jgi:hypothetical protein